MIPKPKVFKEFRVVTRSDNANSFCLHGHILMARDGEAWEVARAIGPWLPDWPKGTTVQIPMEEGQPQWAQVSCEIPRKLPLPPPDVIKEVFA